MLWPLRRATAIAPDAPAVSFEGVELTHAEVWGRCRRLAGGLHALGVGRGDRVAVVAENSHRYLELYQAVPGAGMVLVPLNHRHADAELRYALADSGATVLFADGDISGLPDNSVRRGDLAKLIGDEISVDDVADAAGTIGYEVLTSLGRRYHRVYRAG